MDSKVFFNVTKLNTLGDYMKSSSLRPVKRRPYREFEYMPELQDKNPIKEFCKSIYSGIKNLFKQTKTEKTESAEKYIGTTIEI